MSNLCFISPDLPEDAPIWGFIVGGIKKGQRRSLDGLLIAGKISIEFTEAYEAGEGFGGLTKEQIDNYIAMNGIQVYTLAQINSTMDFPEWTDYSKVPQ